MKTWEFEGQQRTFAEICAEVPALSKHAIRTRLRDGYTTRIAMLSKVAPKVVPLPASLVQYSLRVKR